MKNNLPPIHPGEHIREALPALGLTQSGLADVLGCSRQIISDIIHGRRGLSVEMCLKLSEVIGSSPEMWARLQTNYDFKMAQKNGAVRTAVEQVRKRASKIKHHKELVEA
jgi:addiction module HigA family antidote